MSEVGVGKRKRVTASEMIAENKKFAGEMGAAMARRIRMERDRTRRHIVALWLAVIAGAVLGVVL